MPAADASSAAVHVPSARLRDVPSGREAGGPLPGLAEVLAAVPDHQRAQGRLVGAATGARPLVEIAEWAASASAEVLTVPGGTATRTAARRWCRVKQ